MASVEFDILHGFLQDGKSLQSKEVHLNQARRFDDMTVVLRTMQFMAGVVLIFHHRHRYPIGNRIAADDESTGMDTCSTHGSLEHLRVFHRVAQTFIGGNNGFLKFRHALDSVGKIHLHTIGQSVRNGLAETVGNVEGHFLHTGHILDGVLGGHRTVGDDMGAVVMAIFVFHPFEHPSATIIVEVGIDIWQRDTVGIEETLKQQVVFQGVYLGDTQTIGHHGTSSGTTSGTYHHTQFVAGGVDKVLHDEEVAGEAHGLHDMKFETDAFLHFLRKGVSIDTVGSVVCQFGQIVCLELDTVEFVETA